MCTAEWQIQKHGGSPVYYIGVDYWGMGYRGVAGLLEYGIRWCPWITGVWNSLVFVGY
jgi:hypothetical protein